VHFENFRFRLHFAQDYSSLEVYCTALLEDQQPVSTNIAMAGVQLIKKKPLRCYQCPVQMAEAGLRSSAVTQKKRHMEILERAGTPKKNTE